MNQKAYSVLFCALLASTFVHELRAKGVAPVSSRLEVFERAASTEVCELECSFSYNISFGITIQVVENVLVIANLSANAAFLIDISSQIVVVLNGTSGAGVAIDIAAQTGVYIKSGLWVASSTTLEVFIKSLSGGLRGIFSLSGAVTFSIKSVSSAILVVINEIVVKLVANIGGELQLNAKVGLQIVIAVAEQLIILLNGTLKGFLTLVGVIAIKITNDLAGLLNALQGLGTIVSKVAGSITALIEAGVILKLELILGAANGLVALINLLLQIGAKIDIGAKLGAILNSAESLFKLIAQLGGNLSIGISGVFVVVANIVALINGNATLEVVLSIIIQYVSLSSQYVKTDLTGSLNATLSGLLSALEQVSATSSLSGLVTIITALEKGTLVIGGVNISVIIQKLLVGTISVTSSYLEVVVYVALQLQAIIQLSLLVPYILLILICKINSAIGVSQLLALGIKLDLTLGGIVGSILSSILKNIVSLILALLTGNFYDALSKIPIFGVIIVALNSALSAASNGSIVLKTYLNAGAVVKSLILGLIQYVSGIYLGISSSIVSQVKAILEVSSSVSASISVNVTIGASGSVSS